MNSITSFTLSPKVYDFLKFLVTIVLPALATFYITVGNLWGLPAIEQVVGTLVASATFLGAIIGISSKNYSTLGGQMNVMQDDNGNTLYDMVLDAPPEELFNKQAVTFQIARPHE